jgi:phage terminase small subunit
VTRSAGHYPQQRLTQKQIKFCEEFLKNGWNANAAARAAGYKGGNPLTIKQGIKGRVTELMDNPRLVGYLQERVKEMTDELQLPLDYIMRKLKWVIDHCIDEDKDINKELLAPGLSAIREVNAIHGNYAAEKRINISVDGDKHIEHVKRLMEKAIEEHKQEY